MMQVDTPRSTRSMQLREALAGAIATTAAAAAPSLTVASYLFVSLPDAGGLVLMAFCVTFFIALGHTMILGVPVTLVLVQKRRFRALPMLVAGGAVGMAPVTLLLLADGSLRYRSDYFIIPGIAFVLGALGGVSFHAAHRAVSGDAVGGRMLPRGARRERH